MCDSGNHTLMYHSFHTNYKKSHVVIDEFFADL